MSAVNTGLGYASESTADSNNTDNSVSQTLANQATYSGPKLGADLSLAQSSGNVFNLADPTATLAAANISNLALTGAFTGLERITDASNLAVERSLDLAKTVQGGQGDQVAGVAKAALWVVAVVASVWLIIVLLKRKKKEK